MPGGRTPPSAFCGTAVCLSGSHERAARNVRYSAPRFFLLGASSDEPFEEYRRGFDIVHRHLHGGNSFLVNYTCATPSIPTSPCGRCSTMPVLPYRLWVNDRFVVFSPEIFVRITDGFIYSHPMKGTMDATLPDARERLLADPKEAAEHATITDLIRNDLSRFATEVTVTRYRYLDELYTHRGPLLQMSSEIRGRLPEDYPSQLGDLFFSLLPAGSITGSQAPHRADYP